MLQRPQPQASTCAPHAAVSPAAWAQTAAPHPCQVRSANELLLSCWHAACAGASGTCHTACAALPPPGHPCRHAHARAGVKPRTVAAAATVGSLWRPQLAAPTSLCRCVPRRAAARRRTSGVSRQPVRLTLCPVSATARAGSSGRRWAADSRELCVRQLRLGSWQVGLLAWAAGMWRVLAVASQSCGRHAGLPTWRRAYLAKGLPQCPALVTAQARWAAGIFTPLLLPEMLCCRDQPGPRRCRSCTCTPGCQGQLCRCCSPFQHGELGLKAVVLNQNCSCTSDSLC